MRRMVGAVLILALAATNSAAGTGRDEAEAVMAFADLCLAASPPRSIELLGAKYLAQELPRLEAEFLAQGEAEGIPRAWEISLAGGDPRKAVVIQFDTLGARGASFGECNILLRNVDPDAVIRELVDNVGVMPFEDETKMYVRTVRGAIDIEGITKVVFAMSDVRETPATVFLVARYGVE